MTDAQVRLRDRSAFTLLELIVATSIIAALVAPLLLAVRRPWEMA
jgi:prepilin-type N-terminal cleavage/methylation domain-containing protein